MKKIFQITFISFLTFLCSCQKGNELETLIKINKEKKYSINYSLDTVGKTELDDEIE